MVASNSRIMDMPTFPDDLVPKQLQGINIPAGWFPYIHGICIDTLGKPVIIFICIDASSAGPRFVFVVQGHTYNGSFDTSAHSYAYGVQTIGTMPKFTIDYHHPHKARIDVSLTMFIELAITYRGPPLWYSKGTSPADMVDLTPTSFVGGYDAPCRITGKITSGTKSLSFSGYGDYEHAWILGSFKWKETNSRWLIFNDSRFYGVFTKTYNIKTGATLASTGRFGIEDEVALTFDDVEWIDDNLQPPKFVNVKGLAKDLDGTIGARIDLKTIQSTNLVIPSIYTQHRMTGKVDATTFDGSAWCETHKPPKAFRSACVLTRARGYCLPDQIIKLYHKFRPQIAETVRKRETRTRRENSS